VDLLDTYLRGNTFETWKRVTDMDSADLDTGTYQQIQDIFTEFGRRLELNVASIKSVLERNGYLLGAYPDGSSASLLDFSKRLASHEVAARVAYIESRGLVVPSLLQTIWRNVGGVCLIGCHPLMPTVSDPFVFFNCPDSVLFDEERNTSYSDVEGIVVAPDELHKANYSGGSEHVIIASPRLVGSVDSGERVESLVDYIRRYIVQGKGFGNEDATKLVTDWWTHSDQLLPL
jgi:hypothetical protein